VSGCPDDDGDGVTGASDACPSERGTSATAGCPDRDNDRVRDREDACHDSAGPASSGGARLPADPTAIAMGWRTILISAQTKRVCQRTPAVRPRAAAAMRMGMASPDDAQAPRSPGDGLLRLVLTPFLSIRAGESSAARTAPTPGGGTTTKYATQVVVEALDFSALRAYENVRCAVLIESTLASHAVGTGNMQLARSARLGFACRIG